MNSPRIVLTPAALALCLAFSVSWLAFAPSAQAQQASTPARTLQMALPAQPLAASLNALAHQAGIALIARPELLAGHQAPALAGSYRLPQALEYLLQGSNLYAEIEDGNIVILQRTALDPVETLSQVTVTGSEQTATSPVYGAIAHRTSTGIKTDTDLLETPQSVSIVTREQVELQGATGIDEALRYTAGVVAAAYGQDARGDWIRVRGFAPAKYLDGLPMPVGSWTTNTRLEPYALERIEVLKGPSSVLYGALPPSGFINAISKRPQAEPWHEITATYGSHDRKELSADFTGPLSADGTWLYRIVGMGRDSDSEVDYMFDRRLMLAPSLTWQPTVDTSLTLLANLQRARTRGANGFLPAEGTLLPNPNGTISRHRFGGEPDFDRYDKNTESLTYLFAHRVNDHLTLRQNARMSWADVDHPSVGLLGFMPGSQRLVSRYSYTPREDARMFAIDTQAEWAFNTGMLSHTLLGGVDYKQSHSDYAVGMGYDVAPLDIFNPVYGSPVNIPADTSHTRQRQDQTGLYLQDQIRWGNGWIATLSARHDWVKTRTDDLLANTRDEQNDRKWSGRVGLNYVFESGFAPYVSYATSFEPAIGRTYSGNAFVPTTGKQVEIGFKYRPAGSDALFSAALFDLTQKNVLVTDLNAPVFGYQIQQGKIRSRGVELEGRVQLNKGLTVIGNYTYTQAKVKQTTDLASLDKDIVLQPRQQAGLWLDYRFPQDLAPGLGVGGGVRYVGSNYGDNANQWKAASYTLIDAQVHYDIDNWRLLLTVNNLADKDYVASCNSITWCYYGYGRSVNLSARYSW